MIINDLDGYYIVFDTKNWNTELDTLIYKPNQICHHQAWRCAQCYSPQYAGHIQVDGQTVHHEYVWSLRAWRFCIKYGKGETHITDLTVNGTPVTSFTTRGNVQIETPKKCTTTMTVYVGSECDASMPNGTQARENHVGSSDRQADNSFISGEDENFTVNGNGSTTGIYEAKLTQDKPAAATLMVFDVSGKLVVSRQMTGESVKQADFKVPASGVYVVKAISENGEHTRKISVK